LVKSETFDWEQNDRMYKASPNQLNNPILGYLAGYMTEYVSYRVKICEQP